MDREKQIEKMAAVIRRPHYSGNETKVLPFAETYATALVNEGYGDVKQARKEAAEEIFRRLIRWKSAVIFDTESVIVAEKSFENAISALAREEYGVTVDVDDTACVAMICTGDKGKKYVEFEDYECDIHKLGKIIKQLKTDKKHTVIEFAEKLKENLEHIVMLAVYNNWGATYEYINELIKELYGAEEGNDSRTG